MAREDILSVQTGQFYVGTSAVIGFTAVPYQMQLFMTAVAAGSSGLWIGGNASLAVGLSAGGSSFGGYPFATGQNFSLPMCGNLYLTAAGSTATISYIVGLAQNLGATLI